MALVLVVAIGAGVLAWRLAEGPLESPWLTAQLQARLNDQLGPNWVTVRSAALAWEGFSQGFGSPVDIRLTGIKLGGPTPGPGRIDIPEARVTLALAPLLAGRVEPRLVELDRPLIDIQRAKDGALSLSMGESRHADSSERGVDAAAIIKELSSPTGQASSAVPLLRELTEIQVRQAELTVEDKQTGVTWRAPDAALDVLRAAAGGVEARVRLVLSLGNEQTTVDGSVSVPPGQPLAHAVFHFGSTRLATVSAVMPGLNFLRDFDTVVTGGGQATVGPHLEIAGFNLALAAGPGNASFGTSIIAIDSAAVSLSGKPANIKLDRFQVVLAPPNFSPPVTLAADGIVHRSPEGTDATLSIDVDRVRFADLPALWPVGLADDARKWVLENITKGEAYGGRFTVELSADPQFSSVQVKHASGSIAGDDLTVHWLRPVPPAVAAQGVLHVIDPDALEIAVESGHQSPAYAGQQPLNVADGVIRITGLEQADQIATVSLNVSGLLPSLLGVLSVPRLSLLSRGNIQWHGAEGQLNGSVSVSLPLVAAVTMDQVSISARAHLTNVGLTNVIAGQTLSQGEFDIAGGNDGMTLDGRALLGGVGARISTAMDFRAGPPSQIQRTMTVTADPDAASLVAIGLDTDGMVTGDLPMTATLTEQRNGAGRVAAHVDLSRAELKLAALGWRKADGVPAAADFDVILDHDRLQRVDPIHVAGQDLLVEGYASFLDGHLAAFRADRLTLGQTKAQVSIQFPAHQGPIMATISGSTLDMSGRFAPRPPGWRPAARPHPASPRGPAWQADIRFDHVILAHDHSLVDFAAHAVNDGERFRDLRAEGFTSAHEPVLAVIAPAPSGRTLSVTAADAGSLLRALDVVDTVDGGRLAISGRYHDDERGHPLTGDLEMDDFRLRNAPAFGKLLQAVTLYGLFDALKGPGVGFNKLMVPFRLQDGLLDIKEARAFSPSLGLTAKGLVDTDADSIDMQGTIVPAYFFNSLLGRMPVIGRLFSPEQGGGLISASYRLTGRLADPAVSVNPLTTLTPGFLRGIFGNR